LAIRVCRICPRLNHFKDEEVVRLHEAGIHHSAFEIGETFCDEGRRYLLAWHRRQVQPLELLDIPQRRSRTLGAGWSPIEPYDPSRLGSCPRAVFEAYRNVSWLYFLQESSVYRILKAYDLIISPGFVVLMAGTRFQHPTQRPHEL
jgi:hypothetical protein